MVVNNLLKMDNASAGRRWLGAGDRGAFQHLNGFEGANALHST